VKLRGFRIETGEIEALLLQHPSVAHAIVTAYTPPGGPVPTNLVAYVVAKADPVDAAALRRHLQAFLPDYMIPAVYVPLDALPLTPNGKVDRARLPQPEWADAGAGDHVPPRTEVERRLVDIWSELLPDVRRIGVTDNFFALGGHSLTAMQFATRFQAEYGTKLALRKLFKNPTIADLVAMIDGPAGG
jgi:aryl carrier-like protein